VTIKQASSTQYGRGRGNQGSGGNRVASRGQFKPDVDIQVKQKGMQRSLKNKTVNTKVGQSTECYFTIALNLKTKEVL
jgi:hypothetical protein